MIDIAQPVLVSVNGKEVYSGIPEPSFVSVLESLDARVDRRLVFDRKIELP